VSTCLATGMVSERSTRCVLLHKATILGQNSGDRVLTIQFHEVRPVLFHLAFKGDFPFIKAPGV
jgi:hypothetical protein